MRLVRNPASGGDCGLAKGTGPLRVALQKTIGGDPRIATQRRVTARYQNELVKSPQYSRRPTAQPGPTRSQHPIQQRKHPRKPSAIGGHWLPLSDSTVLLITCGSDTVRGVFGRAKRWSGKANFSVGVGQAESAAYGARYQRPKIAGKTRRKSGKWKPGWADGEKAGAGRASGETTGSGRACAPGGKDLEWPDYWASSSRTLSCGTAMPVARYLSCTVSSTFSRGSMWL